MSGRRMTHRRHFRAAAGHAFALRSWLPSALQFAFTFATALVGAFALTLPSAASAQQLTVSAAASLTNAFRELGAAFEAAEPGTSVRMNFAASGVLLQQLVQGAPVDVFASADQETMDRAAQRSLLVEATRIDFATNDMVLVEPASGAVNLGTLQDLAGPQVKRVAIGKPATVPAGRYAKELLVREKLWTLLQPKLIQADSVRQVLDYVGRGEVEAGFVYRTDAAIMAGRVRVVTAAGDEPVTYPVAVVKESPQPALAGRFVAFLATPAARQVLRRHGFGTP